MNEANLQITPLFRDLSHFCRKESRLLKFIGVVLGNGNRKERLSTSSMMPEQRLCLLKYSKDVTSNWITENVPYFQKFPKRLENPYLIAFQ